MPPKHSSHKKHIFPTWAAANAARQHKRKLERLRGQRYTPMYVYPVSGGFCVTSSPPRKRRRKKKPRQR